MRNKYVKMSLLAIYQNVSVGSDVLAADRASLRVSD